MIGNPNLAKEIILAAKEASNLPVSVKTRIGLKTISTEEWANELLEAKPAALTFHGRTQKQMSIGPANWDEIAKVSKLRDGLNLDIPIIGNGDVKSIEEARFKCKTFNLDGAMIGRGIFDNPWLFMEEQKKRTQKKNLICYGCIQNYLIVFGDKLKIFIFFEDIIQSIVKVLMVVLNLGQN